MPLSYQFSNLLNASRQSEADKRFESAMIETNAFIKAFEKYFSKLNILDLIQERSPNGRIPTFEHFDDVAQLAEAYERKARLENDPTLKMEFYKKAASAYQCCTRLINASNPAKAQDFYPPKEELHKYQEHEKRCYAQSMRIDFTASSNTVSMKQKSEISSPKSNPAFQGSNNSSRITQEIQKQITKNEGEARLTSIIQNRR